MTQALNGDQLWARLANRQLMHLDCEVGMGSHSVGLGSLIKNRKEGADYFRVKLVSGARY